MSDTTNHILPFTHSAEKSKGTVDPDLFKRFEATELERRTELISQRDSLPPDDARPKAQNWLASEMGRGQIALPIDKHTFFRLFGQAQSLDEEHRTVIVNWFAAPLFP